MFGDFWNIRFYLSSFSWYLPYFLGIFIQLKWLWKGKVTLEEQLFTLYAGWNSLFKSVYSKTVKAYAMVLEPVIIGFPTCPRWLKMYGYTSSAFTLRYLFWMLPFIKKSKVWKNMKNMIRSSPLSAYLYFIEYSQNL